MRLITTPEIMEEFKRLQDSLRRLMFEVIKSLGIFWLIERMPWLRIKEPWNNLYKRDRQSDNNH